MNKKIFLLLFVSVAVHAAPKYTPELTTVFSHGLCSNKYFSPLIYLQGHKNGFVRGDHISFNYGDAYNPFISNLGQDEDIAQLDTHCKKCNQVILVGISRGGSAIINYLGSGNATNIRAAVVESPFDHVESIQKYAKKYKGFLGWAADQVGSSWLFTHYKKNGLEPIESALKISKDIPILFIASKEDAIVPDYCTINLYKILRAHGYDKVHLLYVDKGWHALILLGTDGQTYKNVVHAFYRHYGLPYDPNWQELGQERFMQCQPNL